MTSFMRGKRLRRRHFQLHLFSAPRRVGKRRAQVLRFQIRVRFQNLLEAAPGGHQADYGAHRHAHSANAGLAAHHRRVHRDALEAFHGTFSSAVGQAWKSRYVELGEKVWGLRRAAPAATRSNAGAWRVEKERKVHVEQSLPSAMNAAADELKTVFDELVQLSQEEQEHFAHLIRRELDAEAAWERAFADPRSRKALEHMAVKARRERENGETQPLDDLLDEEGD